MRTQELLSLEGRRALITGGGRGLGRALAVGFAQAGAGVVVVGRREDPLLGTQQMVRDDGGSADVIVADITKEEDVQRIGAEAGQIDILVNNAAIFPFEPWETVSAESWADVYRTNLYAPFRLCQLFAPPMVEREWGRIINIASVYGSQGPKWHLYPEGWGPSSYFATKHGINGVTHYLASRLAPHVTINSISPGGIITPDHVENMDEQQRHRLSRSEDLANAEIMMKRAGDGDDYVAPAVMLASPGGRYITGQVLMVDGGWSAW
jgi:NAD(P)-dependent dehydrogenase (short-subunit alcohol dehydrogenase family)